MRQTGVESRAETRAERERAGRDETQRRSAGRDESRATAETKRVSKERRKAREKTRAMAARCSSSGGALSYIARAQWLPWRRTGRAISTSTPMGAVLGTHLAPLAPLTRAAHARYCIRHARVTTPPTH